MTKWLKALGDAEILPALTVSFPKKVKIENARLAILYWVISGALTFLVIYNFVMSEGHLVKRTPVGDSHYWVTNWKLSNDDATKALNAKEDETSHCRDPDQYSFCDTADCSGWSAIEMQCIDICTKDMQQDCLQAPERFVKSADNLFFPTFFEEVNYEIRKTEGVTERAETQNWKIVKGVEDMGIGMDHEYSVVIPGKNDGEAGSTESGSSRNPESNLLTVLNDASGQEIQRWQPGEAISFSLAQILSIAQIDLDQIVVELGHNYLAGTKYPEGIISRLSGTKIWVDVEYHNRLTHSLNWNGPVAIIRIKNTVFPAWQSKPMISTLDSNGSKRFRYYHGIHIEFSTSGAFAWVSTDAVIGLITSLLVFVGVAKKIVYIFTARCLGLISQVYKGYLYQYCSLHSECVALASRLCSHTSTFVELKDFGDHISFSRLHRRMTRIFSPFSEQLDAGEIDRLTGYVYSGIMKQQDEVSHDKGVTCDGFSHACSHGEPLQIKTLISLFDANQSKNCVERFFAGPEMHKLFNSDRAMVKRQSTGDLTNLTKDENPFAVVIDDKTDEQIGAGLFQDTACHQENAEQPQTLAVNDKGKPQTLADSHAVATLELAQKNAFDMLQQTIDSLQTHVNRLEANHQKLTDTVQSQRSEIDAHQHRITELWSLHDAHQRGTTDLWLNVDKLSILMKAMHSRLIEEDWKHHEQKYESKVRSITQRPDHALCSAFGDASMAGPDKYITQRPDHALSSAFGDGFMAGPDKYQHPQDELFAGRIIGQRSDGPQGTEALRLAVSTVADRPQGTVDLCSTSRSVSSFLSESALVPTKSGGTLGVKNAKPQVPSLAGIEVNPGEEDEQLRTTMVRGRWRESPRASQKLQGG